MKKGLVHHIITCKRYKDGHHRSFMYNVHAIEYMIVTFNSTTTFSYNPDTCLYTYSVDQWTLDLYVAVLNIQY